VTSPEEQVVADQEPTNAELAAELVARMNRDQEARSAAMATDAGEAVALVRAVDADNTRWLKSILDQGGWPGRSVVGEEGALAAWLLAQHADQDLDFQRRCLAMLDDAVCVGEADAGHWAYLVDRVRCAEGRPQVYGTQFWCGPLGRDALGPRPIEDVAGLDERRRVVGLGSFADYERLMHESEPGAERSAAPVRRGMRIPEDEAVARVLEIRERLRRRDPAAFAGDRTWWPMVFDQLESGQF
jgi:hypothetical protein